MNRRQAYVGPRDARREQLYHSTRELCNALHTFVLAYADYLVANPLPVERQGDFYIDHKKAANEVGVTTKTIIRWIKNGKVKAMQKPAGTRIYQIPLDEWERFKNERRRK